MATPTRASKLITACVILHNFCVTIGQGEVLNQAADYQNPNIDIPVARNNRVGQAVRQQGMSVAIV